MAQADPKTYRQRAAAQLARQKKLQADRNAELERIRDEERRRHEKAAVIQALARGRFARNVLLYAEKVARRRRLQWTHRTVFRALCRLQSRSISTKSRVSHRLRSCLETKSRLLDESSRGKARARGTAQGGFTSEDRVDIRASHQLELQRWRAKEAELARLERGAIEHGFNLEDAIAEPMAVGSFSRALTLGYFACFLRDSCLMGNLLSHVEVIRVFDSHARTVRERQHETAARHAFEELVVKGHVDNRDSLRHARATPDQVVVLFRDLGLPLSERDIREELALSIGHGGAENGEGDIGVTFHEFLEFYNTRRPLEDSDDDDEGDGDGASNTVQQTGGSRCGLDFEGFCIALREALALRFPRLSAEAAFCLAVECYVGPLLDRLVEEELTFGEFDPVSGGANLVCGSGVVHRSGPCGNVLTRSNRIATSKRGDARRVEPGSDSAPSSTAAELSDTVVGRNNRSHSRSSSRRERERPKDVGRGRTFAGCSRSREVGFLARVLSQYEESALRRIFTFYATKEWIRLAHQRRTWDDIVQDEECRPYALLGGELRGSENRRGGVGSSKGGGQSSQVGTSTDPFGTGMNFVDFMRFASDFGLFPGLLSNGAEQGQELLRLFLSARLGMRCSEGTPCDAPRNVRSGGSGAATNPLPVESALESGSSSFGTIGNSGEVHNNLTGPPLPAHVQSVLNMRLVSAESARSRCHFVRRPLASVRTEAMLANGVALESHLRSGPLSATSRYASTETSVSLAAIAGTGGATAVTAAPQSTSMQRHSTSVCNAIVEHGSERICCVCGVPEWDYDWETKLRMRKAFLQYAVVPEGTKRRRRRKAQSRDGVTGNVDAEDTDSESSDYSEASADSAITVATTMTNATRRTSRSSRRIGAAQRHRPSVANLGSRASSYLKRRDTSATNLTGGLGTRRGSAGRGDARSDAQVHRNSSVAHESFRGQHDRAGRTKAEPRLGIQDLPNVLRTLGRSSLSPYEQSCIVQDIINSMPGGEEDFRKHGATVDFSSFIRGLHKTDRFDILARTTVLTLPEFVQCICLCALRAFSRNHRPAKSRFRLVGIDCKAGLGWEGGWEWMSVLSKLRVMLHHHVEPSFRATFNRALLERLPGDEHKVSDKDLEEMESADDGIVAVEKELDALLERVFYIYAELESRFNGSSARVFDCPAPKSEDNVTNDDGLSLDGFELFVNDQRRLFIPRPKLQDDETSPAVQSQDPVRPRSAGSPSQQDARLGNQHSPYEWLRTNIRRVFEDCCRSQAADTNANKKSSQTDVKGDAVNARANQNNVTNKRTARPQSTRIIETEIDARRAHLRPAAFSQAVMSLAREVAYVDAGEDPITSPDWFRTPFETEPGVRSTPRGLAKRRLLSRLRIMYCSYMPAGRMGHRGSGLTGPSGITAGAIYHPGRSFRERRYQSVEISEKAVSIQPSRMSRRKSSKMSNFASGLLSSDANMTRHNTNLCNGSDSDSGEDEDSDESRQQHLRSLLKGAINQSCKDVRDASERRKRRDALSGRGGGGDGSRVFNVMIDLAALDRATDGVGSGRKRDGGGKVLWKGGFKAFKRSRGANSVLTAFDMTISAKRTKAKRAQGIVDIGARTSHGARPDGKSTKLSRPSVDPKVRKTGNSGQGMLQNSPGGVMIGLTSVSEHSNTPGENIDKSGTLGTGEGGVSAERRAKVEVALAAATARCTQNQASPSSAGTGSLAHLGAPIGKGEGGPFPLERFAADRSAQHSQKVVHRRPFPPKNGGATIGGGGVLVSPMMKRTFSSSSLASLASTKSLARRMTKVEQNAVPKIKANVLVGLYPTSTDEARTKAELREQLRTTQNILEEGDDEGASTICDAESVATRALVFNLEDFDTDADGTDYRNNGDVSPHSGKPVLPFSPHSRAYHHRHHQRRRLYSLSSSSRGSPPSREFGRRSNRIGILSTEADDDLLFQMGEEYDEVDAAEACGEISPARAAYCRFTVLFNLALRVDKRLRDVNIIEEGRDEDGSAERAMRLIMNSTVTGPSVRHKGATGSLMGSLSSEHRENVNRGPSFTEVAHNAKAAAMANSDPSIAFRCAVVAVRRWERALEASRALRVGTLGPPGAIDPSEFLDEAKIASLQAPALINLARACEYAASLLPPSGIHSRYRPASSMSETSNDYDQLNDTDLSEEDTVVLTSVSLTNSRLQSIRADVLSRGRACSSEAARMTEKSAASEVVARFSTDVVFRDESSIAYTRSRPSSARSKTHSEDGHGLLQAAVRGAIRVGSREKHPSLPSHSHQHPMFGSVHSVSDTSHEDDHLAESSVATPLSLFVGASTVLTSIELLSGNLEAARLVTMHCDSLLRSGIVTNTSRASIYGATSPIPDATKTTAVTNAVMAALPVEAALSLCSHDVAYGSRSTLLQIARSRAATAAQLHDVAARKITMEFRTRQGGVKSLKCGGSSLDAENENDIHCAGIVEAAKAAVAAAVAHCDAGVALFCAKKAVAARGAFEESLKTLDVLGPEHFQALAVAVASSWNAVTARRGCVDVDGRPLRWDSGGIPTCVSPAGVAQLRAKCLAELGICRLELKDWGGAVEALDAAMTLLNEGQRCLLHRKLREDILGAGGFVDLAVRDSSNVAETTPDAETRDAVGAHTVLKSAGEPANAMTGAKLYLEGPDSVGQEEAALLTPANNLPTKCSSGKGHHRPNQKESVTAAKISEAKECGEHAWVTPMLSFGGHGADEKRRFRWLAFRDPGARRAEALLWHALGIAALQMTNSTDACLDVSSHRESYSDKRLVGLREAAMAFARSAALLRECGDEEGEARALRGLGTASLARARLAPTISNAQPAALKKEGCVAAGVAMAEGEKMRLRWVGDACVAFLTELSVRLGGGGFNGAPLSSSELIHRVVIAETELDNEMSETYAEGSCEGLSQALGSATSDGVETATSSTSVPAAAYSEMNAADGEQRRETLVRSAVEWSELARSCGFVGNALREAGELVEACTFLWHATVLFRGCLCLARRNGGRSGRGISCIAEADEWCAAMAGLGGALAQCGELEAASLCYRRGVAECPVSSGPTALACFEGLGLLLGALANHLSCPGAGPSQVNSMGLSSDECDAVGDEAPQRRAELLHAALDCFGEALKAAQSPTLASEDREIRARVLGNIGNAHFLLGDALSAVEAHSESCALRESALSRGLGPTVAELSALSASYGRLGQSLMKLGPKEGWARAADAFRKQLEVARCGSGALFRAEAVASDNLGRILAAMAARSGKT